MTAPDMRREIHYGDRLVSCFTDRPSTLDEMLRDVVARAPRRTALVLGEKRVSYAELNETVERVAQNFAHAGLKKGERVALLLGNCLEFVYLCLAASRRG